jgi:hypothetical protein
MTKPYFFGFPSSIKGISFPGKPRIITIEAHGGPCPPGNYSYNGEPFNFFAPNPIGGGSIVGIGTPGSLASFQAWKIPPSTAPKITSPFSADMMNRFYAWEQPVPLFLPSAENQAGGILFLEIDNIATALNNPTSFQILIDTLAHGTGLPPTPPQYIWYLYLTGVGQSFPGPRIIATGNIGTQSFLDQSGFLPPSVDPTSPAQVSNYGAQGGGYGLCDMFFGDGSFYTQYKAVWGIDFSPGPSTQAEAQQEIQNMIDMGTTEPGYVDTFQWAIAPSPPPPGFCSWNFTVRSWRRANNFKVNPNATLGAVSQVSSKGRSFAVKPLRTTTAMSGGANPTACTNTLTIYPKSMNFTVQQNFS